jgi:L-ascorbate metabolism protein UlaG (beta-lactamase superfamily)
VSLRQLCRSLVGFGLLLWQGAALAAGCLPVAGLTPGLTPASFRLAAIERPGEIAVTFIGHASFLIETPDGARAITDYTGRSLAGVVPDIVTMNNAHSSHYTDIPDPRIKFVLRGWDTGQGAPAHDVRFQDLHVRNVPTNVRDFAGGTRRNGNSIFIFEAADVCIAHLGHLHHVLTDLHLAEIGQIDVLMVPVDGFYTLDQDQMLEVIAQIRPFLVLPMHYFTAATLKRFLDKLGERYPVRLAEAPRISLSRATMPRKTEVVVLPGD